MNGIDQSDVFEFIQKKMCVSTKDQLFFANFFLSSQ